jgi:hypothetical protein
MATKSVTTDIRIEHAKALFGEHPVDVIGNVRYGSEKFEELGALFQALISLAETKDCTAEGTIEGMKVLARLGRDVANDSSIFLWDRREAYRKSLQTHCENEATACAKIAGVLNS